MKQRRGPARGGRGERARGRGATRPRPPLSLSSAPSSSPAPPRPRDHLPPPNPPNTNHTTKTRHSYNKQLLKVFPHPLTITNVQFFVGTCLSLAFWAARAVPRPPALSRAALAGIWPLAVIHVLGNVLTNVSLGAVAVSFTHTVKAMEPFFSVLMSAIFLGEVPPPPVLLTLVPIVGGVLMASLTEVTFNWTGFLSALLSNITFQSRNVLSKKLMLAKEGAGGGKTDSMALFQTITVLSFFMLLPVTLAVEGAPLLPGALAAAGVGAGPELRAFFARLLVAGLCFHGYQQLSYSILSRVTPVTHSIGNCVKRVVVIVASVVAFSHPMSQQNMAGTAVALGGVFLYSQAKRKYKGVTKIGGGGGGGGGGEPAAA